MHYYQFNIADYRKDTVHLSPVEHYIYRQLIDWYYLDESPIPKETQSVMRRLGLVSENKQLLLNVLNDFFVESENGWIHGRIEEEIAAYHAKKAVNTENGKKGGRPKKQRLNGNHKPNKTQSVNFDNPTESEKKPNQELLTKELLTKELLTNSKRGTRLPADWKLTEEYKSEAKKIRPDWPEQHIKIIADGFKDYWIAKTGSGAAKRDWLATWRNWCRNDRTPARTQSDASGAQNNGMRKIKPMPMPGRPQ